MPFTSLRDPVQPSRDPDIRSPVLIRVMSWVMTQFIEGFASCAVGFRPNLMWLTDERSDQASAAFSGTMHRPSAPDISPRETIAAASTASQPARAAGRHRDD
jgi:hypothetical protein